MIRRPPPSDDLRADQAREHVVRTRSSRPRLIDRCAAERWRRADPRNAKAYRDAETAWAALDHVELGGSGRARRQPRGSRLIASAVAASVFLGGLLGLDQLPAGGLAAMGADYRTAPGELRELQLSDGSRVKLDGASALDVVFTAGERRLKLIAGRARFEVRPKSDRPFIVEAGRQSARATGTAFQVTRHDDRTSIEVEEGQVLAGSDIRDAVMIRAGEGSTWVGADRQALKPIAPQAFEAWTRGRIIVTDAPLREVADALQRASGDRIVILGAARTERVTAVFDAGDPKGALRRLDTTLPIRIDRPFPGWVVIRRAPGK